MTLKRIHRSIFPNTDHGRTEVEWMWFERDGARVSPVIPCTGWCERLWSMPGGPIRCDIAVETALYAPDGVRRVEHSESTHSDGFYEVGPVCITKVKGP